MRVSYNELNQTDLIVDAIYESNGNTNLSGDVLGPLMGVGNMGGFRIKRQTKNNKNIAYIVLESTGKEIDWIDKIDIDVGRLLYYGDNREPGREIHATKGNIRLKEYFKRLSEGNRKEIPPFFYFTSEEGRNRQFKGLLVPGDSRIQPEEQLVAVWRSKTLQRYQNYRAYFTILNTPRIDRKWIDDLLVGKGYNSLNAPAEWKQWVTVGIYTPLESIPSVEYRTKAEQIPSKAEELEKIKQIYSYFKDPYTFELCAIRIIELMDSNIRECQHTRYVKDGGRDAVGKYRIGNFSGYIDLDFILEAKCYDINNGIHTKEVARLISRLRYRQFGILVTTSYVDLQAYKELKEDQHPVVIVSAKDILEILYKAGYKTLKEIDDWLHVNFLPQI